MTLDEAKSLRAQVRQLAEVPDEVDAHLREDQLHVGVLREIVENECLTVLQIRQLAAVALSTECLDFQRWYT